jgi:A/G-specific adenine glycosylase
MDLGATVCTPRSPDCDACPWSGACAAHAGGEAERYPVRAAKATRPVRHGLAFIVRRGDGAVLLRRRAADGLLGGMTEVPSTPWRAEAWTLAEARKHAPIRARWRARGRVLHGFTHFDLVLDVVEGTAADGRAAKGFWRRPEALAGEALPSVMRKVARLL